MDTQYTVNYAMAPNVRAIDETFDSVDEALEAAWEMVNNGVQYDQAGDYDPDEELSYLCVLPTVEGADKPINCLFG